jgi:hypothetical protein
MITPNNLVVASCLSVVLLNVSLIVGYDFG